MTDNHTPKEESRSVIAARMPFMAMSSSLAIPPFVREMINKCEDLIVKLVTQIDTVRLSQVRRIDELEIIRLKYEDHIGELEAQIDDLEGKL